MSSNTKLPVHVGFILDGNRRWAKENGLPKLEGHKKGYENLKSIAEATFERGVKYVTAYIFSTENWNREKAEVKYLMDLALVIFQKDMNELMKKGYRIEWLGIADGLSKKHLKAIDEAVKKSADNTRGTIGLCFNYGGRQEMVDAANRLISSGKTVITEEDLEANLYASDMPAADLIIRTSGEMRLSNFLLWRSAYSELHFTDKHWPEFSIDDLDMALEEYASRHRRFGG